MKTAAILGPSSMLGRELTRQLLANGVEVVTVGRRPQDQVQVNLGQPLKAQIMSDEADVLFHCAAAFNADDADGVWNNLQINTLGCANVLELMKQLNCKQIIYAGSLFSQSEDPVAQLTSYGLSKAQGEELLAWGMAIAGGIFCSLRLPQLYDTEGLCCKHQPWFGRIIAYASRGLVLRLPPSIGVRNFLHISDAARLLITAAKQRLKGIWPSTHMESIDHTQLAELAYQTFDAGGHFMIDPQKQPFREVIFPNAEPLFEALQERPQIMLSDGLVAIREAKTALNFGPLDVY